MAPSQEEASEFSCLNLIIQTPSLTPVGTEVSLCSRGHRVDSECPGAGSLMGSCRAESLIDLRDAPWLPGLKDLIGMSPRGLQGVPNRGNRVSKRSRDKTLLTGYRELDVAPVGQHGWLEVMVSWG